MLQLIQVTARWLRKSQLYQDEHWTPKFTQFYDADVDITSWCDVEMPLCHSQLHWDVPPPLCSIQRKFNRGRHGKFFDWDCVNYFWDQVSYGSHGRIKRRQTISCTTICKNSQENYIFRFCLPWSAYKRITARTDETVLLIARTYSVPSASTDTCVVSIHRLFRALFSSKRMFRLPKDRRNKFIVNYFINITVIIRCNGPRFVKITQNPE